LLSPVVRPYTFASATPGIRQQGYSVRLRVALAARHGSDFFTALPVWSEALADDYGPVRLDNAH